MFEYKYMSHAYVYAIVHVHREIEEKRRNLEPPLNHKKRTSKNKIPHRKVGVALFPSCKGHLTLNGSFCHATLLIRLTPRLRQK